MNGDRQGLISYYKENGKDKSWSELAKQFGLSNGEVARKIISRFKKRDKVNNFIDGANIVKVKQWEVGNGEVRKSVHYSIPDESLERLEKLKDSLIEDIKTYVKPVLSPKTNKYSTNENCLIINIFDAHLNKLCFYEEDQSLEKNIEIFESAFDTLLYTGKFFEPEIIYFPIGGDYFHTDSLTKATTGQTPQDCITSPETEFREGVKAIRRCIDKASDIAKVKVILIEGNHDRISSFFLGQVIGAIYENNEQVEVEDSRRSRKYFKYGQNLFGFCHGDREVKKIDQLPLLMAEECKKDWGNTTFREWFIGDRHHRFEYKFMRNKDFPGCSIRFLRSVSGVDYWHNTNSYIGIPKTAELFVYNKEKGLKANFPINIV